MREIPSIDLTTIEKRFTDQLEKALKGDVFKLLQSIPVKNSPIPHAVATTLGYKNFDRYRAATLSHIQRKTPQGERMLAHIKSLLPELPNISG